MNDLHLPQSPDELAERLKILHEQRKYFQAERRKLAPARRRKLTADERAIVLAKTAGHCHLCGGDVTESSSNSGGVLIEERAFAADHIVPYAYRGKHSIDNYLAAHGLCNGCRWFYSPEEFQWILRMGIWARKQMEDGKTAIGVKMRKSFLENEEAVRKRRKPRQQD